MNGLDFHHEPVLVSEVCALLQASEGSNYLDVTCGGGGHAEALLMHTGPTGKVLAADADPHAVEATRVRLEPFGDRVRVVQANFRDVVATMRKNPWIEPLAGVIADLGISSFQVDAAQRGFSFRDSGILDMRFDPGSGSSASDFLIRISYDELVSILIEYGGAKHPRRLAKSILTMRDDAKRKGESYITVPMLTGAVASSGAFAKAKLHPATQVLQALRMAVNDELLALRSFLTDVLSMLPKGSRLAVIAFHSGEDRIIKQFFRQEARDCICPPATPQCVCQHRARLKILTKKPVVPSRTEVARNPRARSARLRVAEIIFK